MELGEGPSALLEGSLSLLRGGSVLTYGGYNPYGPGPRRYRRRTNWVAIVVALVLIAVVVALLVLLLESTPSSSPGLFGRYDGLGLFGIFFVLILVFFLVRVAFWGARAGRRGGGGYAGDYEDPAKAIARRRYARGEITKEQYDELVRNLGP